MLVKRNILAVVGAISVTLVVSPAFAQSTDRPLSVLPPIEALTETIERPLFREDRRPPTVDPALGAPSCSARVLPARCRRDPAVPRGTDLGRASLLLERGQGA